MFSLSEIVAMNNKPPKEIDLITADGLVFKHKLMPGKSLVRMCRSKDKFGCREYNLIRDYKGRLVYYEGETVWEKYYKNYQTKEK
jgi:hypothetical protein